jgi:Ni/Co efflux regulator RcnB
MSIRIGIPLIVVAALTLAAAPALGQGREEHGGHGGAERAPPRPAEPHPGPSGYERPAEPRGWNARPATVDRGAYQHNYQAARVYHVGPFHPPRGWSPRHWGYGQILPRAFWAPEYILADYWLFGLEIPPSGFEWVRDGADALLIDTNTGEILQVEYGVFG